MRRMYSENELKNLIGSSIASGLLQDVDINAKSVDVSGLITGAEIIEKMSGYSFTPATIENVTFNTIYVGVCKNGNKLTLVCFGEVSATAYPVAGQMNMGTFNIPSEVGAKLYPIEFDSINVLSITSLQMFRDKNTYSTVPVRVRKGSGTKVYFQIATGNLSANVTYLYRFECTFLLTENLAPSGE